ncbi:MAG: flagellar biosynthesis protein FlgA [Armatimonadota bacterium]|jgi:predicted homoserine dehydrogenase-like protein
MSLPEIMSRRPPHEPVRAGVIGTGAYGSGIVAQAQHVPLLQVPIVADADPEKARQAYRSGGGDDAQIVACDDRGGALTAIEAGRRVVTADPLLLMDLPLDVVVECTGVAEAGALHGREAIRCGKHVVMVTKETDVTVGPVLKHLADEAGLVYAAADGDQHGLATSLVTWARRIGLEVVCAGKARNAEIPRDAVADADAWMFGRVAPGEAERYVRARKEQLGDLARPGHWDLVELTILANATGLRPDVPSTHHPAVYTSEIPTVLCDRDSGGILAARGAVDVVTCLRHPREAGLGGGVFVVVHGRTELAQRVLGRASTAAGDGSPALLTRPYHLLGLETIETILTAGLLNAPTAPFEYQPRYDAVFKAPRDIGAGEVINLCGEHRDAAALIVPAAPVADGAPLPGHLADDHAAAVDIAEGTVITREMVSPPSDSVLWSLRAHQDEHFLQPDEQGVVRCPAIRTSSSS